MPVLLPERPPLNLAGEFASCIYYALLLLMTPGYDCLSGAAFAEEEVAPGPNYCMRPCDYADGRMSVCDDCIGVKAVCSS